MKTPERVAISEFRVTASPAVLAVYGLGSCVGVALYDTHRRIGGLAHTLLSVPPPGQEMSRPGKFVSTAIQAMLEEMLRRGAERKHLGAKIVGGADMFGLLHVPADQGIGARNARTARETLGELGIPLLAEDVGGDFGRTMEFDLSNGTVRVRTVQNGDTSKEL
jgi:chemotaxis protein CheD